MQGKVGKVFIGKDISRTSSPVLMGASQNLSTGEIFVLDSNKNIMTAGATYSDTRTVYIAEALAGTYSYVNEAGTSVTGVQKIMFSDPIDGAAVAEYLGSAYSAAAEEVWSIDLTGWTPVVGTEYRFKIVYKDLTNNDYPTQFTHSYSYIAETATLDTEGAAIAALINADSRSRVTATYTSGTNVLALTGIAYDDNDSVDSINEYAQVSFEVGLTSDNYDTLTADPYSYQSTDPSKGSGTYKLVRDEERWSLGYEGVFNRTAFPVLKPDMRTVKDETYDCVVIHHKNWITTADRREEQVDITTKVFIPNTATSNQMTDVLAVLNPWMASLPKPFDPVTF
jgi:hypothetical protein